MPSQRRVRLLFYVILAGVVTMLFFTSHYRQTQTADTRSLGDFYHKTMEAMNEVRGGGGSGSGAAAQAQAALKKEKENAKEKEKATTPVDHDGDGSIDDDDEQLARQMAERLRAAEQKAKDNANAKAPNKPNPPSEVIGVGSSARGQSRKPGGSVDGDQEDEKKEKETEEDRVVEAELNSILAKSPVIIFSKSYCMYSKRVKGVLLEKYAIEPAPYVVELDQHPLGLQMQARLADMTGRKTVPNVMINGKSIGGSDDVAALDQEKALVEKIQALGGKRVEIAERFVEDTN